MGVLSDDFAAVDFREELCYHSRPKKQIQEVNGTAKPIMRKLCAAEKAAADPQAVQRGRLRAAALSRRRKLRFWAACFRNPPVLLRYVSSSQKIFALQIFFGSPVSLGFPCCSCCLFRGVCLAAARVSAPHLSMPSTRHGAKACFVQHMETAAILIVCRLIVIE